MSDGNFLEYMHWCNLGTTCPSCGHHVLNKDIEWVKKFPISGRVRPERQCHTCGVYLGDRTAQEQSKLKYDEQVLIQYNEKREPAKNVKYKLIERNSMKVLQEGKTNERGLTERLTTEKQLPVDVIVFRLNDDRQEVEKNIGSFWTNDRKDSIEVININRGRIFFDIRYVNPAKDKAESFIKAAETIKKQSYYDKYRGDVWWSFDVTTECDIKEK
jgi:hypothetical protein